MNAMDRVTLLGVPLDALIQQEAVNLLLKFLNDSGQHHVMTPNSEMLVAASKSPSFRSLLQRSALNLPDSAGLLWAARKTGQRLPERVTGVDTVQALCRVLPSSHSVFLLGAGPGIAAKAAEVLRQRNPSLVIAGTYEGSPKPEEAQMIVDRINEVQPHLLLVAFGAPAQDEWIAAHLSCLPSVRIAMGVGGTFDFLAGVQKRAPVFLQKLGLEWTWRFLKEPTRAKRMWNAVVVFPRLVRRYGKEAPPL
jgi:N-acetylglucosaminyldiphosphoundecaprenol N-acetyl-beta-D-mannosaminyltransferase